MSTLFITDSQQIKPLSPLRSSDRRKIANEIIADFKVEVPSEDPEIKEINAEGDQSTGSIGVRAVRNSLLPEGTQSARFTTTAGPDLKQVSGTVYVGAHAGEDQRVLWLSINDRLIPTVYTLWKHPQLVPLLYTQDFVLSKMQGGADLMTPGLTRGPPFPREATKGALVAVASIQRPSVPQWVGVCEIDVSSLGRVQGTKGHAVNGQHWAGDEIWAWSPSGKAGTAAPEQIDGWDIEDGSTAISSGVGQLTVDDTDDEEAGGVSLERSEQDTAVQEPRNEHVEGENPEPYERVDVPEKELSTKGKLATEFLFRMIADRLPFSPYPMHWQE